MKVKFRIAKILHTSTDTDAEISILKYTEDFKMAVTTRKTMNDRARSHHGSRAYCKTYFL